MPKKLLFSLTKKDFIIDTFRCGGNGGQNVNKRETGVRITHPPSGASVRCCDERQQAQNKHLAFMRLTKTKQFQAWHKIECSRRMGQLEDIEKKVDRAMDEKNLKVEYF